MPVDLSKIGLEGIESYYSQQESKSRANYNNVLAEAGRAKIDQDARNEEISRMASLAAGKANADIEDDSQAGYMETLAHSMIDLGGVEMGSELLKKASEVRENEAQAGNAEATQRKTQLEMGIKTSEYVSNVLTNAGDSPEEFNTAIGLLETAASAGEISMPEGSLAKIKEMGWSPEVVKVYQDFAIKAKDQYHLDLQSQQEQRLADNVRIAQNNADRLFHLAVNRDQRAEEAQQFAEKQGGKNKPTALVPTAVQLADTRTFLKATHFSTVVETKNEKNPAIDTAATYIASDALQRVKDNPALPWALAQQQSLTQAIADGVLYDVKTDTAGRNPNRTTHMVDPTKGLGKTPATALVPKRDPQGKPTGLVVGKYYSDGNGGIILWTDKGGQRVQ